MKITNVEAFLMSYVFPEPLKLQFWGGERTILKRDAMLVKISTDAGLVGYGPGPASERAQQEITNSARARLAGQDPARWRELREAAGEAEIALLDLAGKAEGRPVSELLGGRVRDRIRLYGSGGMYMPPEQYAEEAAGIAALGFSAYKMRPGIGPEGDLEAVRRMRQAVGPEVKLMVDAHTWWRMGDRSYSYDTVRQLCRDMAPYHPAWLEEPLPPEDHDAYRRLKHDAPFPLATGEHEHTLEGFLDLITTHAADYIQSDVCCQGGFAMGEKIFDAVAKHGLQFVFHSWGTQLEVLAAAQLGITRPESVVAWLEFPCHRRPGRAGMYPFPLAEEILAEPLPITRGELLVPKRPGLGLRVDETVVHRYPYQPGPWSFFRLESPPETLAVVGDHSVKWTSPV
ncbi:MAG TPA: mandelate racemase/muconate lactonizing enzyme family protein [Bryobacterales bacterium]|nr:mandelate racemase/muconate lactonizing enzyme family protein [Bryobacterales bacterium]